MKIYVASSWRNKEHQQTAVHALRQDGHEVYDFTESESAFNWGSIDPDWKTWSPGEYVGNLLHPLARAGFDRDMKALRECDAVLQVMPCGASASWEAGYAVGAGKLVMVWVAEMKESGAELMVNMSACVTTSLDVARTCLRNTVPAPGPLA